jgi:hypothetical protein
MKGSDSFVYEFDEALHYATLLADDETVELAR